MEQLSLVTRPRITVTTCSNDRSVAQIDVPGGVATCQKVSTQTGKARKVTTKYTAITTMSSIDEAEAKMSTIEQRLLALESDTGAGNNSAAVEQALAAYQKQVLEKLKVIRSKIMEEGGDVSTIKKERDDAVAQNALLKKEVERQNYRIQHLIKALNLAEEKANSHN